MSSQSGWGAVPLCIRDLAHSYSDQSVCEQRRIEYWVHQRAEEGCERHFHGCGRHALPGDS